MLLVGLSGCGGATRSITEDFPPARDWFENRSTAIAVVPAGFIPSLSLSSRASGSSITAAGSDWSGDETPLLKDANEHLRHSLEDQRPQLLVSHAVVLRLRQRTAHRAQLKPYLNDQEKTLPGDPINGLVEIQLTRLGLVIEGDVDRSVEDPRVAFEIRVQANVYSSREGTLVHRAMGRWEYSGSVYRLSELTAENARLLNEELEAAARLLARRIVN